MKISKEAIISFLIGVVLVFFVSVFRAFKIDYIKIPAHAIVYFAAGFCVYRFQREKRYTSSLILLPSVLVLIFASFTNFNAIHKWIIELLNLSISFAVGYSSAYGLKRKIWVPALWIGFTILLAFVINPRILYSTQFSYREKKPLLNSEPLYRLKTLSGSHIFPDSLHDKTVLLDFWYLNCAPCITKMKQLSELSEHYRESNDVVIMAVNDGSIDTSFDTFRNAVKKLPKNIMYVYDSLGVLARKLKVSGYPTEFILNKNGIIKDQFIGFNKDVSIVYVKETVKKIDRIKKES